MIYTPENLKYCLLSFAAWEPPHSDEYAMQPVSLSGLFNWSLILNGCRAFPRSTKELEKFNLLHVNLTANNINLIPQLLKIWHPVRNDVELMFNVDYAIELWNANFKFPSLLLHFLDYADHVFSVEQEMAGILEMMLHRKVACIPHPVDVDAIKKFRTTQRRQTIAAFHHVYDSNLVLPSIAINAALLGKKPEWSSTAAGGVGDEKEIGHLYDNFLPYSKNFEAYMRALSEVFAAVESYTLHSYGRTTTECAALGVPVVGSRSVSSQAKCFPDLATETNSVCKTTELLKRLIDEPQFWTSCAQMAMANAEYYSFENCKKMMIEFLNS